MKKLKRSLKVLGLIGKKMYLNEKKQYRREMQKPEIIYFENSYEIYY